MNEERIVFFRHPANRQFFGFSQMKKNAADILINRNEIPSRKEKDPFDQAYSGHANCRSNSAVIHEKNWESE